MCSIEDLFGWTWNKLFRREIIQSQKIRFDETISLQEDHLFTLEYVRFVKSLIVLPYYPYHYSVLDGSLMNRRRNYVEWKKVIELLLQKRLLLANMIESSISISYRKYVYESFILASFHSLSVLYDNKNTYEVRITELNLLKQNLNKCIYGFNIRVLNLYFC